MPSSIEKQKFLKKFKTKAQGGWKKKAGQEAKVRGQMLPDNLVGAIAQVSSYRIGEYDDGTPYVTIVGIAKSPDEIVGQRVNIKHSIKETESKTVDQCLENLSSDLQLLGGKTVKADGTPRSEDEIPTILDEIVAEKPHFEFNTRGWEFNGKTGVSVFIQGLAEPVGDDVEEPEEAAAEEEVPAEEEAPAEEVEAPSDEEEPWEPAVGEEYKHKGKACEITGVQKSEETVTIKKGKAVQKNVPWSELESAE